MKRRFASRIGLAEPADVVVIAGKGHEDYQEIAGVQAAVRRWRDRGRTAEGSMNAEFVAKALATRAPSGAAGRLRVHARRQRQSLGQAAASSSSRCAASASTETSSSTRRSRAGPLGIVCERGRAGAQPGVAFFEVPDTLRASAISHALTVAASRCPVVAITGSNGKTTTKNLLRSILVAAYGDPARVLATEGNLNNLIGMPLTLLALSGEHRAAIFEMGMNAFGEIARLAEIAEPTVGLITCVAPAHLEGLGSIDGVARAKGEAPVDYRQLRQRRGLVAGNGAIHDEVVTKLAPLFGHLRDAT